MLFRNVATYADLFLSVFVIGQLQPQTDEYNVLVHSEHFQFMFLPFSVHIRVFSITGVRWLSHTASGSSIFSILNVDVL